MAILSNVPDMGGSGMGGELYALQADAQRIYDELVAHLAASVFRDAAQERLAARTGCFAIAGQVFSVELDPGPRQLVVRCQMPALPATAPLMRAMLESSLDAEGVVFGLTGADDVIEASLRYPVDTLDGVHAHAGPLLVQRLSDAVCRAFGHAPVMALVDQALLQPEAVDAPADRGLGLQFAQLMEQLSRDVTVNAAAGAGGPALMDIDGLSVAVRHDPGPGLLGLYADMGFADESEGMDGLARLLRANADATHAPAVFGLHPVSGRLVACMHLSLAALDAPLCREFAVALAGVARSARQAG